MASGNCHSVNLYDNGEIIVPAAVALGCISRTACTAKGALWLF